MNVRWLVVLGVVVGVAGASGCDRLTGGDDASEDEEKKSKKSKKAAADDDDDDDNDDNDSTDATAPEKFDGKVFQVGETAELSGLKVTLKQSKTCTYEKENHQKSLEKNGQKIVAVELLFEGTSDKAVRATRIFRAYDEDRLVFDVTGLGNTDCQPDLKGTKLNAGDKAKGWVGFKVPKDAKGLSARFEHQPLRPDGATETPEKQFPEFTLEGK